MDSELSRSASYAPLQYGDSSAPRKHSLRFAWESHGCVGSSVGRWQAWREELLRREWPLELPESRMPKPGVVARLCLKRKPIYVEEGLWSLLDV